ncbi:MAG TPA: prephenate dehydratase domain-containing protein [Saprospiraceae bacterium]|nr:prephenate dehydratase domain-containing protein [Saprospiraceae bacterium]
MMKDIKVAIQGYAGSFHDEVAQLYFKKNYTPVPADSFDELAGKISFGEADYGIMAIENSIAGTILQNYRILREHGFWIRGEAFHRIELYLLTNEPIDLSQLKVVESHPMALNQCLQFLSTLHGIKRVESLDTALSAQSLAMKPNKKKAVVASRLAAETYGLHIQKESIETHKTNYTRFFIVSKNKEIYDSRKANKVSAFIKIPDKKGQLLKVLQKIQDHDLNLSKLQSFPVLGAFREYFFHMDIEFDHLDQYFNLKDDILEVTSEYEELGIYARADISEILWKSKELKT